MILVMDSSAIIALLRNEDGGLRVAELLGDSDNTCYMHAINMCEVYYGLLHGETEEFARGKVRELQEAGILIRSDMDPEFWQSAGKLKAELARISLVDCLCVTLANRVDAEVLTSDRHEFERVVHRNLCPVRFIR